MQWWLHFFESPHRSLLYSLKTLNESEVSGAKAGIVHSCSTLGFMCCVLGAPRAAKRYHVRATRIARESDNPVVVSHAALGLGWHSLYTGRWSEALEQFHQSAEASRGAGDLRQWGSARWGMVLVLCHKGSFAEAWTLAKAMFGFRQSSGEKVNFRWSHVAEGILLLRVGAIAAADHKLRTAVQSCQEASDWQIYIKAQCKLARSSLVESKFSEAANHVTEARATARKHGLRGHYVSELRNLEAMLLLAKLRRAPRGALTTPLRWRAGRACSLAIRGDRKSVV